VITGGKRKATQQVFERRVARDWAGMGEGSSGEIYTIKMMIHVNFIVGKAAQDNRTNIAYNRISMFAKYWIDANQQTKLHRSKRRTRALNEPALQVKGFRKTYGDFPAVAGISFTVGRGEIFGLLGPNGAGKTTTLECLEGLRKPDAGQLSVMGINPEKEPGKLSKVVGIQLQTSGLPANMRVIEAMNFFSAYHRMPPRLDLLERMGLSEKQNAQYHQLSTGQQRRLALALAIAHQPPLVILDEPTAGLDVGTRVELHTIMAEMRASGTTILLATHDMAEAEKMADRVAILLKGQIVATGSPTELTATGEGLTKVSVRTEQSILQWETRVFPGVHQQSIKEDYTIFFSTDPGPTVSEVLLYLAKSGDRLIDLRVERPSLEERFLEITNPGGIA
jgi:ABC-2 type transport system ATP-binding protein